MNQADTAPPDAARGFSHEIRNGAWRQSNVIFALIFKEFKTRSEGETYGGMVWVLLDPLINVIVLATFWYLARRTEIAGVHVALFIAVGTIPFTIARMCMSTIPSAIRANRSFYNFQQVKPIDSLIARFALNMSLAMLGEVMMFFLLGWYLDLYINFANLLQLMFLLLLSMAMGFGMALLIGTYGTLYDIILKAISFASRPLIFVSAVFYTPNDLPATARYVISWNPIAQIIEYMRFYALGIKLFPEASIVYPMVFTLVVLFLGFTGYYVNRSRLIQTR